MTIPVVIVGVVVLSVTITVCTIVALGCCLWPTIQEMRRVKRLKEQQNEQKTPAGFANVNQQRA